jgi:hypothetical protein
MTRDIVTRSTEAANRIAAARRGSAFDSSVQDLVCLLRTVPDQAVTEWDRTDVNRLQAIADEVVQRIEKRLDQDSVSASVQQRLATAIYDIRAAVEEADRWERHYAPR